MFIGWRVVRIFTQNVRRTWRNPVQCTLLKVLTVFVALTLHLAELSLYEVKYASSVAVHRL